MCMWLVCGGAASCMEVVCGDDTICVVTLFLVCGRVMYIWGGKSVWFLMLVRARCVASVSGGCARCVVAICGSV